MRIIWGGEARTKIPSVSAATRVYRRPTYRIVIFDRATPDRVSEGVGG